MDLEAIYERNDDCTDQSEDQTWIHMKNAGKARLLKGRRSLVLVTVSLGLICVLLLVFIIWLNISITAERDRLKRYETTVQEFNHTINSLQTNYTDLRTEKDQLKKSLSSLSQKNLEMERNVTSCGEELQKEFSKEGWFFLSNEAKSWSEIRQFCRDRGADLVMIKTEEKQRFLSSLVQERVWIGLTDVETEGVMKWVDNSTLIQGQGFWVKGQPSNYGGNEHCIEMNFNTEPLNSWNDHMCSDKRKGICEK